ncbi:hypothetical protein BJV77DRAFT_966537 [Russula vinacea]|nr:hypothetical protein BJV77DRAFT_966537 [Russula vinacea]
MTRATIAAPLACSVGRAKTENRMIKVQVHPAPATNSAENYWARLRQGDVPERLIRGGKMHLILEMIRHVRMGREPERLCELDVKQREGVQKRKETLCAIEWGKAAFFAK